MKLYNEINKSDKRFTKYGAYEYLVDYLDSTIPGFIDNKDVLSALKTLKPAQNGLGKNNPITMLKKFVSKRSSCLSCLENITVDRNGRLIATTGKIGLIIENHNLYVIKNTAISTKDIREIKEDMLPDKYIDRIDNVFSKQYEEIDTLELIKSIETGRKILVKSSTVEAYYDTEFIKLIPKDSTIGVIPIDNILIFKGSMKNGEKYSGWIMPMKDM